MEVKGEDWMELMIETAKEELERLESNHPHQFEFFKIELKSFISQHQCPPLSTCTIATQDSSSGMKRKPTCLLEKQNKDLQGLASGIKCKRSCSVRVKRDKQEGDERVEGALERAKACLQKIHDLKAHLLYS